jgi:hypothetical protein
MLRSLIFGTLLAIFLAQSAVADVIRLTNGDTLHGEVLSLDAKSLALKSQTLGELKIAREQIASIQFGDAPAVPPVAPAPPVTPAAAAPAEAPAKPAAREQTADDVVRQLRESGIDPAVMRGVTDAIPLLNTSPEAQEYFSERVGGLISGQLDVGDIRKDAEKAVAELEDLKREFGPQMGPAIDPYLGILKRFLRETNPTPAADQPPASPSDRPAPPKVDEDLRKLEGDLKSGPT